MASSLLANLKDIEDDYHKHKESSESSLACLESMRANQVDCAMEQLDLELSSDTSFSGANSELLDDSQFEAVLSDYETMKLQLEGLFKKLTRAASS
ncbi:hypothetical protein RCL1_004423 [Eukaryota sp. TZLM3-RCL]